MLYNVSPAVWQKHSGAGVPEYCLFYNPHICLSHVNNVWQVKNCFDVYIQQLKYIFLWHFDNYILILMKFGLFVKFFEKISIVDVVFKVSFNSCAFICQHTFTSIIFEPVKYNVTLYIFVFYTSLTATLFYTLIISPVAWRLVYVLYSDFITSIVYIPVTVSCPYQRLAEIKRSWMYTYVYSNISFLHRYLK